MLRLAEQINALPASPEARAFLIRVLQEKAWTRIAEIQARHLGLRNRDALRRFLMSLHLPQWGMLKRWFRVYYLVAEAEGGNSFAKSALAEGHNTSSVYRTLEGLMMVKPSAILQMGGTALLIPEFARVLDRIRGRLDLVESRQQESAAHNAIRNTSNV